MDIEFRQKGGDTFPQVHRTLLAYRRCNTASDAQSAIFQASCKLGQFDHSKMPQSVESTILIDFSSATVVAGLVTDTYILTVEGEKPYINMKVSLIPRIYVVQPEYWEIEVVGTLPGIGLPALKAYSVFTPLEGIRGKKGIKVIGSKEELSIDVPAL